jgi:hypothetical protein
MSEGGIAFKVFTLFTWLQINNLNCLQIVYKLFTRQLSY